MTPLRKINAAVFIFLLFLFSLVSPAYASRRIVALLPTLNHTEFEVWDSKYYPVNVLELKMTGYLAELLRRDPFTDVKILDHARAERWFAGEKGSWDFAVQMEIFSVLAKEREALGTYENSRISLRVHVYDGGSGQRQDSIIASGKDSRYTFDPGDDRLYFFNARDYPVLGVFQNSILGEIHKDGIDLLRLTPPDKGQKMSRPTWKQFSSTSGWQAFKNAITDAAAGISDMSDEDFAVIGRIIAPTADSTLKRREYIISLGSKDALAAGDVLQVIRGDRYITVDPENPVVILPRVIGNVKVVKVLRNESVVVLLNEKPKDPVQLNDLVKASRIGIKKAAPLK